MEVHACMYVHMCVCVRIHAHTYQDIYMYIILRANASKHPSGFRDTSCDPVRWKECHPKARNLHFRVQKMLHLPRNLRVRVNKVPPLPQNLHFRAHKVLPLPRNLL